MALSSAQVAAIVGVSQQNMSAQFAAIQQQNTLYGTPMPGSDPWASVLGESAGNVGSWMGQAPDAALTGIGLAAAFQAAPRMLDPFTGSFNLGYNAYKGGGMAAGIGVGAAAFGAYTAAGAAFDYGVIDPFKTGAQMRGQSLGALSSIMPGNSMASLGPTANMIESIARGGQATMPELTGLMQQGVLGGNLNTGSITQFQQQFQQLVAETKNVANILHTSLNEAYTALEQVKSMGVSNPGATIGAMAGLGASSGLSPSEMFGIASGGAMLAKQAGISRDIGVNGAMTTGAMFSAIGRSKAFGNDFGIDDAATFQNGAYRFLGSQQGTRVLAAMMDSNGQIDSDMANRIASGNMTRGEINRAASRTMSSHYDLFQTNNEELASSFVSEYGPQGIAAPLRNMTNNGRERKRLTGMNNEQLGQLAYMGIMGDTFKEGLMDSGPGEQAVTLGLKDSLQMAMAKMTAPLRTYFEKLGSEATQWVAEKADDLSRDFMSRPRVKGDPFLHNAKMQAAAFGQSGRVDAINSFMATGAGQGGGTSFVQDSDMGAFASILPSGLTHPNAPMNSLPGGGWGHGTNGLSSAAIGSLAMVAAESEVIPWFGMGSMSASSIVSRGIGTAGASMISPGESGLVGMMRGTGVIRGAGNALGWGLRGGGALLGAASAIAGGIGAVLGGVDLGTAAGNNINWYGLGTGDAPGSDYGDEGRALRQADAAGLISLQRNISPGSTPFTAAQKATLSAQFPGATFSSSPTGVIGRSSDISVGGDSPIGGINRDAVYSQSMLPNFLLDGLMSGVELMSRSPRIEGSESYVAHAGDRERFRSAWGDKGALVSARGKLGRMDAGARQLITEAAVKGDFASVSAAMDYNETVQLGKLYNSIMVGEQNNSLAYWDKQRKSLISGNKGLYTTDNVNTLDQTLKEHVEGGGDFSPRGRAALHDSLVLHHMSGSDAGRLSSAMGDDGIRSMYAGSMALQAREYDEAANSAWKQARAQSWGGGYGPGAQEALHVAAQAGIDPGILNDVLSGLAASGADKTMEPQALKALMAKAHATMNPQQITQLARYLSQSDEDTLRRAGTYVGTQGRVNSAAKRNGITGGGIRHGQRFLEETLGVDLRGSGKDFIDYINGKSDRDSGTIGSTANHKLDAAITAMIIARSGNDHETMEDHPLHDIIKREAVLAARKGEDAGPHLGAIAQAMAGIKPSGKGPQSSGDAAIQMNKLHATVDGVIKALEPLTKVKPKE